MELVGQQRYLEVADLLPAKLNARGSFLLGRAHATLDCPLPPLFPIEPTLFLLLLLLDNGRARSQFSSPLNRQDVQLFLCFLHLTTCSFTATFCVSNFNFNCLIDVDVLISFLLFLHECKHRIGKSCAPVWRVSV